jgi:hypothetical protein
MVDFLEREGSVPPFGKGQGTSVARNIFIHFVLIVDQLFARLELLFRREPFLLAGKEEFLNTGYWV